METKLSDILIDMSVIIENNPELWSKYNFAANEKGAAVKTWLEEATCWCVIGFLEEFARKERQFSVIENEIYNYLNDGLRTTSPIYQDIAQWNDKPKTTAKIVSKKLLEEAEYFFKQGR